jgi:hypothetical protein
MPNSVVHENGFGANFPIEEGTEYEVDFDLKFHSQFTWSRGGKVGFGFRIGKIK